MLTEGRQILKAEQLCLLGDPELQQFHAGCCQEGVTVRWVLAGLGYGWLAVLRVAVSARCCVSQSQAAKFGCRTTVPHTSDPPGPARLPICRCSQLGPMGKVWESGAVQVVQCAESLSNEMHPCNRLPGAERRAACRRSHGSRPLRGAGCGSPVTPLQLAADSLAPACPFLASGTIRLQGR